MLVFQIQSSLLQHMYDVHVHVHRKLAFLLPILLYTVHVHVHAQKSK